MSNKSFDRHSLLSLTVSELLLIPPPIEFRNIVIMCIPILVFDIPVKYATINTGA